MREILTGGFAPDWSGWLPRVLRVVDWNIERGQKLAAVMEFLESQNADLLVLQEVDVNARRTGKLNVAVEIARRLGMQYVFGREFDELAQGSREAPAYTGQATLSRWPLENPRLIRFRRQSGFWRPRWWEPNLAVFQPRLGGRIALVTEVRVGSRSLVVYNVHLESRDGDELRQSQLAETLANAGALAASTPVLITGDLNIEPARVRNLFQNAGFCDAIGEDTVTTPRHGMFAPGRSIDRAMVRGEIRVHKGTVHSSVQASDHYPLSFDLEFVS